MTQLNIDNFVMNVPAAEVVAEPDFHLFMLWNNYTTSKFNESAH